MCSEPLDFLEEMQKSRELPPRPGFTQYAELLNGRAAMIGFIAMLVIELALPESGGLVAIVNQLLGGSS